VEKFAISTFCGDRGQFMPRKVLVIEFVNFLLLTLVKLGGIAASIWPAELSANQPAGTAASPHLELTLSSGAKGKIPIYCQEMAAEWRKTISYSWSPFTVISPVG
jgi:hypothetical protein